MPELTSQDSIEFNRPFLVVKDYKGKTLCINPKYIACIVEDDSGAMIEMTNGTGWLVMVTLKDLINKIEESNCYF
jgi:uncharacterized protein YlzI (FlbEa/FlbD family)